MPFPPFSRLLLFVLLSSLLSTTLANNVLFGAYIHGGIWSGMSPIYRAENSLGHRFNIVHWFTNWDTAWDAALVKPLQEEGRLPFVTWEAHQRPLQNIINGHYDPYLRSWAQGIKAYPDTVYLRIFPEMNGDWTPWSGDPPKFIVAWQHVVDLFRAEGVENVRWVWAPNETDEPRTPENRMEVYYPGHAYVDVLAVSGYNWGNTRPWLSWRSFEEIFSEPYRRLSALGPQPIWVAEVASSESGGDKSRWVQDMFNAPTFPRLGAVIWFDENKETDWHFSSSEAVLQAFRYGLSTTRLVGN